MSQSTPSMPGWRDNLRNPKRWVAQIKRTVLWLAGTYAALYVASQIIPGGLIFVMTESIPRGIYWHDTRPFQPERGHYIRIEFTPTQPWIAERYARPVDYPQHVKTVGGLPGDLIVADAEQNYFICQPVLASVASQVPNTTSVEREGMQCRPAGRPMVQDSQGRPMSGWLAAGAEYQVQEGEIWTFAPHLRSMDSRYYGPLPTSKIVSSVTPLLQID